MISGFFIHTPTSNETYVIITYIPKPTRYLSDSFPNFLISGCSSFNKKIIETV